MIINREHLSRISELYEKENVHLHYICLGQGTAGSEVMDMLGLASSDKAVVFSFAPRFLIKEIMEDAIYKLKLMKPGNGVAFTMPITGVSKALMQLIEDMSVSKGVDEKPQGETDVIIKYALVVAVVGLGRAEKVVFAAKDAGAGGGTVILAKQTGSAGETFFGISINVEREIVLILTSIASKDAIIEAINASAEETAGANPLIFSIPVEEVAGVNLDK